MENYDKLKSVIQAANPEIMELKFGCDFIHKPSMNTLMFCVTHKNTGATVAYSYIDQETWLDDFQFENPEEIEIIGRPVRLADVLLALSQNNKATDLRLFDNRSEGLFSIKPELLYMRHGEVGQWNLKDDNLDHQSDKTKQFLINLLT
jgi:hypothetical protein